MLEHTAKAEPCTLYRICTLNFSMVRFPKWAQYFCIETFKDSFHTHKKYLWILNIFSFWSHLHLLHKRRATSDTEFADSSLTCASMTLQKLHSKRWQYNDGSRNTFIFAIDQFWSQSETLCSIVVLCYQSMHVFFQNKICGWHMFVCCHCHNNGVVHEI